MTIIIISLALFALTGIIAVLSWLSAVVLSLRTQVNQIAGTHKVPKAYKPSLTAGILRPTDENLGHYLEDKRRQHGNALKNPYSDSEILNGK